MGLSICGTNVPGPSCEISPQDRMDRLQNLGRPRREDHDDDLMLDDGDNLGSNDGDEK